MGLNFIDFAALYGTRKQPIIVTDADLEIKFVNHFAALLSVMQLRGDFIRKSLTPASMQRVQRCRRTKEPVIFTQYFGEKYKEKYRVEAEWAHKHYIVFTFSRPHGVRDAQPLIDTLAEGNMDASLEEILSVASLPAQNPNMSAKQLAARIENAALNAIRCSKQTQHRFSTPCCYSFHMPTLLDHILRPCNKYLEQKDVPYRINYSKPTGQSMVKCDARLLRYVLYSLMSTTISLKKQGLTLHYEEYPDCVRLNIYSGEERPIIVSKAAPGASQAICDSMSLTAAYILIEKMQGELDARWLADDGLHFTITLPVAETGGGFREQIASQLEEPLSTLKIEFSIL